MFHGERKDKIDNRKGLTCFTENIISEFYMKGAQICQKN
jgi:hypothetical protein